MDSYNFRQILKEELNIRIHRNFSYSLSVFAKDIGIKASQLSEILSGRYGISSQKAQKISQELNLSKRKSEIFILSATALHARGKAQREEAHKKLNDIIEADKKTMDMKVFSAISEWYYFAILELCELHNFQSSIDWIAKQLNLDLKTTEEAIRRLVLFGFLTQKPNGELEVSPNPTHTTNDEPSDVIKKYHSCMLTKAKEALHEQDVEKRFYHSSTISINKKDLEFVKKEILDFRNKLISKLDSSKEKDDVYSLSVQFFSLVRGV